MPLSSAELYAHRWVAAGIEDFQGVDRRDLGHCVYRSLRMCGQSRRHLTTRTLHGACSTSRSVVLPMMRL